MLRKIILLISLMLLITDNSTFASEKSLDLKKSIALTLENNPVIISLKKKLSAQEEKARQVAATFLPSLTLEGGYGELYSEPYQISLSLGQGQSTSFSTLPNNPYWGSNYTFTLKQPIYTGGKIVNNLAIAQQGILAAKEELQRNKEEIIFKVIDGYLNILKLKKFIEVQKNKFVLAQKNLKKAEKMHALGMAVERDVLAAKIVQTASALELKKSQHNLLLAQISFANLLGKGKNINFDLSEINETSQGVLLNYENLLANAYLSRSDWKLVQINKKINDLNIRLAYSGYFPNISLIGDYGWKGLSYINSDLKYSLASWDVLAGISWTLFDGLGTAAKVREAEATKKAGIADEENYRNSIALEVKEALLSLETNVDDYELAQLNQSLARLNLKTMETEFKVGLKSELDLFEAKTNLLQSEAALITAKYNLFLNQAKINKVVGEKIFELNEK